ncbi:transposase, partial [Corynebacterium belfantii]|uniref:transposase n=1 Tax=Corynebacterium belfantii TaxID=2014537 RepID=UPI0018D31304
LGVDEHVWKHTRKPGQASHLVTILVDLTPLVDGHEPARLLDIRPGRSADVFSGWLKERDPSFQEQIPVVTMDGFTGYTTAVEEQLPQANKVIDP